MSIEITAQSCANEITQWFNSFYHDLESAAREMSDSLAKRMGGRTQIADSDLVDLAVVSRAFLEQHRAAAGAGAIFAVASLAKDLGALEWWLRDEAGRISKREFDLIPDTDSFYDYEQQPWFTIAARTGHLTMVGPYLDYLGMGEYIVTLTVPLYVHEAFVGVTGSDIRVVDLETVLVPALRTMRNDAALLNGQDRVIVGNSGRFLVGDRIRELPAGAVKTALDVPGLDLHLLYLSS
ncbi:cache domain-containing protein [Paenarthrobacter sp. NPDC089675]|uniref:cache domain-containing protein n=1 Tax=Paenarthrobacter TaxID=1742992 RepID=UPI00382C0432